MTTRALVVHGHFYQPPRENPWAGHIEHEPSAHPFPNWNERIHYECYRANAFARILDDRGATAREVNNYARISFNFGATLLRWLERHHPETHARIVAADAESARRLGGHGNAIAQSYHHSILTLTNARDRRTEVRWGLADFRRRFGREAEALWLPETACNADVLETLIEAGLKFVILSPYQAERVRPLRANNGDGPPAWRSVADGQIDPTQAYKYLHRDGTGRAIAVFFYDGHVAKAIAFDGLLASSRSLLDRFELAGGGAGLVNVATDGESYGHHFRHGERCLAYALSVEAEARGFAVTNYGAFLSENPPALEVEIKEGPKGEGTAWSCAHGVGRWRRDCSCHAGARAGWNQKWREPLREALDLLRDDAANKFETIGGDLLRDPWAARDDYVEMLIDPARPRQELLRRHAARSLGAREEGRATGLLEVQRHALVMYTSCGWFFNDISGIEAVQVMRYAGRVIELMDEWELDPPRARFLDVLACAYSNIPEMGNGADIFRRTVERSRVSPQQAAERLALSGLLGGGGPTGEAAGF